jgi:hypothetical protein
MYQAVSLQGQRKSHFPDPKLTQINKLHIFTHLLVVCVCVHFTIFSPYASEVVPSLLRCTSFV